MTVGSDYSFKASIGVIKRVPGGYLQMGSRYHPREEPQRSVYVSEFEIAQAPVTVYQYAAFLNTGAVREKRWWSQPGWAWLHGATDSWGREDHWKPDAWDIQRQHSYHPVVGVSWFEAEAYCNWVAHEVKRVVRLPTENEWEYAARGDDGRPFPWGERFADGNANTLESGLMSTLDATGMPEDISPYGVMDMAGNVQEWTTSSYLPLPDEDFYGDDLRVARGGSYNDTIYGARTSYRRAYPPGYYYPFLGFRVVVSHR
jgi:formylglycine-generating enzyme required for sulfatase activity